jgi:hypothetical protein
MNTRYGRYGATYNMVGLRCFNEELSLLPKNPTEAKLQATSTWGESTEPTSGKGNLQMIKKLCIFY